MKIIIKAFLLCLLTAYLSWDLGYFFKYNITVKAILDAINTITVIASIVLLFVGIIVW